ncbi:zinc ribbon domain-containing protein [Methanobacterium spitsbergense]|uniref:Zinc ribbon domain-containing protein n=1 Tax=Methanobacterium spitsbergense TaxID=2874285 RepID=A0A8T5V0X6_9EURY|nr:zinc ribbon domain-containing protein [Methanobacterium spitsbergense]MBZ2166639.1 zinc ribbon domain-containing protein [Methanobacterium spitsbergense]
MYCKECGAKIEDGKFCSECGANLKPVPPKQKERQPVSVHTADILLTLIIPILGIFIGIDYLLKNKGEGERGIGIIILSLFLILIYGAILIMIGIRI